MHPVTHRLLAAHAASLRDLVLVMWEDQVNRAGMDVELLAEVPGGHSGAFDVPAGKAEAPGTLPVHLARGVAALPQGKILRRLLTLPDLLLHTSTRPGAQVLDGVAG